MDKSVLTFISHSSEDKESFIEPIVADLEDCYINVWLDKRKILPGENLRKSIFRDGLDKADIALIFFTEKSLKSSWVDREIKHVLREETKKGNNFDLNKIISIFDSKETYEQIAERYPELTDDLLHLMPVNYNKIQLGQLISAIWSKYLSLQGGDVETQRQLLEKEKEIFQKEKEIQELKKQIEKSVSNDSLAPQFREFAQYAQSGKIDSLIRSKDNLLTTRRIGKNQIDCAPAAIAFSLLEQNIYNEDMLNLTDKGKDFFQWYILNGEKE